MGCVGFAVVSPVVPMREKTNVKMTLESDGRWSIPGGLAISRGSEKIYRNGLRQVPNINYILDPMNPHYIRPSTHVVNGSRVGDIIKKDADFSRVTIEVLNNVVVSDWNKDDIIIMDYLY